MMNRFVFFPVLLMSLLFAGSAVGQGQGPGPGQRWLTAQGTYAGAFAELQVYSSSGGLFDQSPPEPVHEMVGSILLQFYDCGSGSITYDFPEVGANGLTGVIPIERVSLDNVTHCQRNNQPSSD